MTKSRFNHSDCRNYAPIDVVRGICHLSKETVAADEANCGDFDKLPKCRHCTHYEKDTAEYLGTCRAQPVAAMAYPDLSGVTCEWFDWSKN